MTRFLKQVTLTVSDGKRWLFSINTPRIYGAQSYDGVAAWIQIYAAPAVARRKNFFSFVVNRCYKVDSRQEGEKKYATRVAESRGAAARIAVLADKYLYVHSRVNIARTRGVVCRRACLFRRRGKKGIHFSREKRGGISRVCFDAFVRNIIFLKAIPCDTDIIKRTTVNEICT